MTPEQLDEIEFKLSALRMHGNDNEYVREIDPFLDPLVKAVREAREERDEALGDARLAESQLDEIVELAGSGGDGSAFGSVESLLCDLKERTEERDEARDEVERLREVVRQIHALAEKAVVGTAVGAWLQVQEIHKITKGMVE